MRKQHFSPFGPHSHKNDCVPFRSCPFQKVVSVRLLHGYRKKSSGPFQYMSRNCAVRRSEPEIQTIRKRTVPFSYEQKNRSSSGPLSSPVWFLLVTPSWFLLLPQMDQMSRVEIMG